MIRSLTGLRFVFALMIFMHHFSMGERVVFPEGGALAVCFFFILSGFVLAYSYQERLVAQEITSRSFYVGRISKLYPLHILCFIVAAALIIKTLSWKHLLVAPINLALLQSWIPIKGVYFSFNAVSWFSSDMLFFYLIFPWLALKMRTIEWKKLIVGGMAILSVYLLLVQLIPATWQHAVFYINPCFRLLDFTLGIVLFKWLHEFKNRTLSFKNKWFVTVSEVSALALLALFIRQAGLIPEVYKFALYYWLPIAFILFVFVFFNNRGGYLARLLSNGWLVRLGEVSFSFYMIHQLIIRISAYLFKMLSIDWPWWIGFILVLSITIVGSFISFYYIEKPLTKWLKSKFS